MSDPARLRIGYALGSGSARGWAHMGVINALAELGVEPDIVCGTSIGAVVAAACAASRLERLLDGTRGLTRLQVARFLNLNWSLNSFIDQKRLTNFLHESLCDAELDFRELSKKLATVATDLESGKEVWFTEGSVLNAVSASIALPGLLQPVRIQGRWLVDGGLVNPVPVSLCRALGADVVIAVNLNSGIVGNPLVEPPNNGVRNHFLDSLMPQRKLQAPIPETTTESLPKIRQRRPGLLDVLGRSINITQDRITRSRMAGDPPDIVLSPRLSHIGLFEFHRVAEAVGEGEQCVARMLSEIRHVLPGVIT